MDLVSIVTPAYNASHLIGDTIKSVQEQSYVDWEMIIIDDCSSDNTVEIVEEYAKSDNRIKLLKAPQNGGVARARNIGLDAAKGNYIAFLDSDDLWMPDKLAKQVSFMQQNRYILTYTYYTIFNSDDGKELKTIKSPKSMRATTILKDTAIACLTVMVDKTQAGDFRMPLLGHTEDNCTWYNILNDGNRIAYCLPEVLAKYRSGHKSMTNNKIEAAKMQWDTYRNHFRFSRIKSAYYFACYAFNAIIKYI